MKWWREQWYKEAAFGIPLIFWLIVGFIAETTIPLVVIAVAMALIVPVEPWVPVVAVVAGWPCQWALLPALIGYPVKAGIALAWVIGVFAAALLLEAAALLIIVPASLIAFWAVVKLEEWQYDREADKAVRDSMARYGWGPKSGPDQRRPPAASAPTSSLHRRESGVCWDRPPTEGASASASPSQPGAAGDGESYR